MFFSQPITNDRCMLVTDRCQTNAIVQNIQPLHRCKMQTYPPLNDGTEQNHGNLSANVRNPTQPKQNSFHLSISLWCVTIGETTGYGRANQNEREKMNEMSDKIQFYRYQSQRLSAVSALTHQSISIRNHLENRQFHWAHKAKVIIEVTENCSLNWIHCQVHIEGRSWRQKNISFFRIWIK